MTSHRQRQNNNKVGILRRSSKFESNSKINRETLSPASSFRSRSRGPKDRVCSDAKLRTKERERRNISSRARDNDSKTTLTRQMSILKSSKYGL